jgi:O-antigen/teichoic acid export membrane protein
LAGFFISSLKTIPSVFLERSVQFQKIVLVQVVENTVFYVSVIVCALSGLGLNSFTVSVVLRSVVGLILMYSISFWRPRIGISKTSLRALLSYGVPFQASSFLALFKDDLITLYLGKVLGFTALGYIGWAKKWAEAPIRIIMDNITRVLFPVISRIQNDKSRIGRVIEKILHYQSLILAPTLLGLAVLMKPLVDLIPRYGKWGPAVPIFYIFVASAYLSTYSTPFINLFNALGKVWILWFSIDPAYFGSHLDIGDVKS